MEIIEADLFGFCFGVNRAVDIVEEKLEEQKKIDTLGPIVHNPNVVEDLSEKGAEVVNSLDEVNTDSVIITAHGAGREIHSKIREKGLNLIDTTCPIVRTAQETAEDLVDRGYQVIIYGENDHTEVRNILGWLDGRGIAILDPNADVNIRKGKVALLSQTTKGKKYFFDFAARFLQVHSDELEQVKIVDTTCGETRRRYEAAERLADEVDIILVVGGKNSANTRKLAEVSASTGIETHHIKDETEIEPTWFEGVKRVGITAGASTPQSAVSAVEEVLEQFDDTLVD
ncbi:MAG: 4-hydroxy-3-methylbut-2-enyl diphosphate reductase [Candidatus Acetothermia bacterium]|nr:4-hydroxy-3-methylbut-2-enyl diphosphate reductase [Candidatus Bipolaricaulota bacterium]